MKKQPIRFTEGTQEIKFKVKRIDMRNYETTFTSLVAKAQPLNCKRTSGLEEVIIRGNFPMVFEGEVFEARGKVYDDFQKGPIFLIEGIPHLKEPRVEKEIINFLRKRVEKLGTKTAKLIVETLGPDCLKEINEKGKEALIDVPNLPEKKAERIIEAIRKQKIFEPLLSFLVKYQIDPQLATVIYNEFASRSLIELEHNPYVIATIRNATFSMADFLAYQLGFKYDCEFRIRQAIMSCMEENTQNKGDMCIYKEELEALLNHYLKRHGHFKEDQEGNHAIPKEVIETVLEGLIQEKVIIEENHLTNNRPMLYLRFYYWVENGIVHNLYHFCEKNKTPRASEEKVNQMINQLEKESPFPFDPIQKEGIRMGLIKSFSILTGGPGTGKTQTTNAIVCAIKRMNPNANVVLLAPTGKAAKRMTELTGRPASTIHSAIGLTGSTTDEGFKKIEADTVIIDESSMIDAFVFLRLLESIGEETRVILVGDFEQLPSVGPGLILRDLIKSERIPVTRLTTIFRQALESQITMNSYAMIKGNPSLFQFDKTKEDFYFIPSNNIQEIADKMIRSFKKMNETYKFPIEDICLLSPMRKGDLGIDYLNTRIQEIMNPRSLDKQECYMENDLLLREGDRVIHRTNNKDLGVFNGEVGYILKIEMEQEKPTIYVSYPDKEETVEYRNKNCEELELAYCMTIHKSQGSEFPVVIMPMHLSQSIMLNRNLIYTAWTRAKKKVICVGDWNSVNHALTKGDDIQRLSQIKEKIREDIELDWKDENMIPF